MPLILKYYGELDTSKAEAILSTYDNKEIIHEAMEVMSNYWKKRL